MFKQSWLMLQSQAFHTVFYKHSIYIHLSKLILLPQPQLSAAGDPIHPPTQSPFLFIFTSSGRVSSFPCRRSLLPFLFSLLFHSLFPGNWVWVLAVGGKGLGWSCWELCVCAHVYVCVLGSELIKDGDP